MKFGLILKGPVDRLREKARKINPNTPVVVVDDTTYNDKALFAVFVFKPFRNQADHFNTLREKEGLKPFAIVDMPLHKEQEVHSIRARIVDILKEGPAYGYEIFKKYRSRHGNISMRLIYYHLKRGESEGLFEIGEIREMTGDFSWGVSSRRKYYQLKAPVNQ